MVWSGIAWAGTGLAILPDDAPDLTYHERVPVWLMYLSSVIGLLTFAFTVLTFRRQTPRIRAKVSATRTADKRQGITLTLALRNPSAIAINIADIRLVHRKPSKEEDPPTLRSPNWEMTDGNETIALVAYGRVPAVFTTGTQSLRTIMARRDDPSIPIPEEFLSTRTFCGMYRIRITLDTAASKTFRIRPR